ncbi:MAG TPA: hypothetical protein VGH97_03085 [Thermoanaerobaculia bacterium]|jgi:hypothetical protein
MRDPRCWGIYRELAHSPGRETDDAEILRAVARELESRGFDVVLKSPDEIDETSGSGVEPPPNVFIMCERPPIVERLASWERRGARIVNRPSGIRNTDRERTIALFAKHSVPFPHSVLVETTDGAPPPFRGPCWIKRGDVHATQEGDVSYAESPTTLSERLATLASRGITRAVVQDHAPGDLIKFYGVSGLLEADEDARPSWFQWFYHRDQTLHRYPFDADALAGAAARAANALGLDVYGGDAIVSPEGALCVIDLNAWPSFALFREVASQKIATLLAERFTRIGVPR